MVLRASGWGPGRPPLTASGCSLFHFGSPLPDDRHGFRCLFSIFEVTRAHVSY